VHWCGGEIVNNALRQSMSWPVPPSVLIQFTIPDSDHANSQWIRLDTGDIAIAVMCRNPGTCRSNSAAAQEDAAQYPRSGGLIKGDGHDNSDEH
jgi:hypothetical protein